MKKMEFIDNSDSKVNNINPEELRKFLKLK
jgi:hypothetical protein